MAFEVDFNPMGLIALRADIYRTLGFNKTGPQFRDAKGCTLEKYRFGLQQRASFWLAASFFPPSLACGELSSTLEVTRGTQLYLGASACLLNFR